MRVIQKAAQLCRIISNAKCRGASIGFVPTMGALHDGHLSLIRRARSENEIIVVSVFVNPTQFGLSEGYRRYPRNLNRDIHLARAERADIVFAPSVREIFAKDFNAFIEPGPLAGCWEGKFRPGHFRGVATIVTKLFNLVQPTRAYFGQKDYQQLLIIERLARDLNMPIMIRRLPTVRDPDGLAMSSRNSYLNVSERKKALVLYRALSRAKSQIRSGERKVDSLLRCMRSLIRREREVYIDYLAIVDAKTLKSMRRLKGKAAIIVAARVGRTRLIDNFLVDV